MSQTAFAGRQGVSCQLMRLSPPTTRFRGRLTLLFAAGLGILWTATLGLAQERSAAGPLRVLTANPRYFTDGSGKAIYLTGSHTWGNLKDDDTVDPPPPFDFNHYLDFLASHNHNFIRLWTRELPKFNWFTLTRYEIQWPFLRTGPGNASDGKPKFDLSKFDPSYFERPAKHI